MKKRYLYVLLMGGLVFSCSGGGDDTDDPDPDPVNTAPTIPSQVYPLSNTLCIDNNVEFKWNAATDAEGNSISYNIEVSENSSFSPISHSTVSSSTSTTISLNKGKSYYWRIKAKDNKSAESEYSSVSHFLTEGEGVSNHLPFAPVLVAPDLNAEIAGTSTILSWTASDVDNDVLTFDVYLDSNSDSTTKVAENQTITTYEASGLTAATTYYFKVVVKDDKGGVTIGQIWSFSTN
jgi:hypothetical protein